MRAFFSFVFFCTISSSNGLHLPNYIKTCNIKSENFKECAIEHGNAAISHLVKGDEAHGIPSLMPYRIPFLIISFNELEMNLTDASFVGVDKFKIKDFTFDPDKKFFSIILRGPLIAFEFDYLTKGRIGAFPIEGNGHGWAKFIDVNYTYSDHFTQKKKNGKHYMAIGKNEVSIVPNKVECELDNLFNGNKQLGDNLNKFLNENWRDLLREFDPVIKKINTAIAKSFLGKFLYEISLEEMFPDVKW